MTEQSLRSMGEACQVPVSSLLLDPENPRLPPELRGGSQEDLAVHLELGFDAWTVAESIAEHGFFGNESLIVMAAEEPGRWIVLEGNRRLTALLGLTDTAIRGAFANPEPWEKLARTADARTSDLVPVVVLQDRWAATPIVGFRHITGIMQWDAFAQARYIATLVDKYEMTFGEVAKTIGIEKTRVANLYRDQAIARQAETLGLETGGMAQNFSLLTVAMQSPTLRDHVGAPLGSRCQPGADPLPPEKGAELRELLVWVFGDGMTDRVINDSREMSKLGNVVASPVGLAALRSGSSLDAAIQKVKDTDTEPRLRLIQRLKAGKSALTAALGDVADFPDDEVAELVAEIRAVADGLLDALGDV